MARGGSGGSLGARPASLGGSDPKHRAGVGRDQGHGAAKVDAAIEWHWLGHRAWIKSLTDGEAKAKFDVLGNVAIRGVCKASQPFTEIRPDRGNRVDPDAFDGSRPFLAMGDSLGDSGGSGGKADG